MIKQLKEQFSKGELDKATFIEQMYTHAHAGLFDFANELANTNIQEIRVLPEKVIAVFSDPEIQMLCPAGDRRIAPVEAFNFGDFEAAEIRIVIELLRCLGKDDITSFDIGANAGFYSLVLSARFPGIHGLAFEPVPTTYNMLQENFRLNGVNRIEARNLGLSNQFGRLDFVVSDTHSGASYISQGNGAEGGELVHCEVRTLDSQVAESEWSPDFIKCDVEGAELLVFQGGEQTLRRHQPIIFTELLRKWAKKFQYHPNDLIAFLHGCGYDCFVPQGSRLGAFFEVTEDTLETNYLFLHREKHADLIKDFLDT